MPQPSMPLGKRTKQEILDEYERLQDQLEELKTTSKIIHSQPAMDLVEKAKSKTPQNIDNIFAVFQSALHEHLSALRSSMLEESSTLQDLQKAVELSGQQLQLMHGISIAADSLNQLVEEQTNKSAAFETEMEQRKHDLEEQMLLKKKAWEREAEEYEYQKKLKRERDQVETEEREKSMAVREAAIKAQEQEFLQMKKTIEQFPRELEAALAKREHEVAQQLTQQFAHQKELAEKEAAAQIRLLELTVKNLEERSAAQINEISSLKQQADEANAKAQTLAIKAIERPTTIVAPTNQTQNTPASYHDQRQGRNN